MPGANPFMRGPSRVWPPMPLSPATLLPVWARTGSGEGVRVAGVFVRPIATSGGGVIE